MTDENGKMIFNDIIEQILKNNNLYEENIDIFRIDETLSYDRYIDVYKRNKIKDNIKSFNNNFESLGGRIYKKDDPIAKSLEINSTLFNYNDRYIYVIPSYLKDYDYLNELIAHKYKKLNTNKDCLVIASPIRVNALDLKKELTYLNKIHDESNNTYSKIMIVNLDKIVIFNMLENCYKVVSIN